MLKIGRTRETRTPTSSFGDCGATITLATCKLERNIGFEPMLLTWKDNVLAATLIPLGNSPDDLTSGEMLRLSVLAAVPMLLRPSRQLRPLLLRPERPSLQLRQQLR